MIRVLLTTILLSCGADPELLGLAEHVERATLVEIAPVQKIEARDLREEIERLGQCVMFFHGERHNFAVVRAVGYSGRGCAYELFTEAWITYLLYPDDERLHVIELEWIR